ncbi:ANTAR domain-containing protein [Streptomyces sp. NPDC021056]|uniref:ANTAR domain-containing protein n=1 Tax=Streptomyces sp. NPDC021056 TaxID=3155012 RepID=UPI0034007935
MAPTGASSDQLAAALQNRIAIEQANAVLAERFHVDADQAFALMRRHARARSQKLTHVAAQIIEGSDDIGRLSRPERS